MEENSEFNELVGFVVNQINNGVTPEEVRERLLEGGNFSNNDIDIIFQNIQLEPTSSTITIFQRFPVLKKLALVFGIGVFMVFIALLVHEGGHILVGTLLGAELQKIILLGVQVYPSLAFPGFEGFFGQVWLDQTGITQTEFGLISMMGSGSTTLLSAFSIILLYLIRPRNFILKTFLVYASLWYLDLSTYTIGLRPSSKKEPLTAAVELGLSETIWYIYASIIFIGFTGALVYYFLVHEKRSRTLSPNDVDKNHNTSPSLKEVGPDNSLSK